MTSRLRKKNTRKLDSTKGNWVSFDSPFTWSKTCELKDGHFEMKLFVHALPGRHLSYDRPKVDTPPLLNAC